MSHIFNSSSDSQSVAYADNSVGSFFRHHHTTVGKKTYINLLHNLGKEIVSLFYKDAQISMYNSNMVYISYVHNIYKWSTSLVYSLQNFD